MIAKEKTGIDSLLAYFKDNPPMNNFRCCSEFGSFVELLGRVVLQMNREHIDRWNDHFAYRDFGRTDVGELGSSVEDGCLVESLDAIDCS